MDITIGIDPGDSTGIAIFDGPIMVYVKQCKSSWALEYLDAFIERYKALNANVLIACERFVNLSRGPRTHQPTAQQMIGALQQLAKKYDVEFILQGPADARSIADNQELKKLGLYVTPTMVESPDANDALMAVRHALFALATNRATIFAKMIDDS